MKKILAIVLALALSIGLTACGDKGDSTEESSTTPVEKSEKQVYYESYFTGQDFGFAGESFKMISEKSETAVLKGQDGTALFRMSIDNKMFELYKDTEGKLFAHSVNSGDKNKTDIWYECIASSQEINLNNVFESMASNANTKSYDIDVEKIAKSEYIETTKDGLDRVKITMKNPAYNEGVKNINYNIEITYKGQEYSLIVSECKMGDMSSIILNNANPTVNFDASNYDVDIESKKLKHKTNGEEIKFKITSETDLTPDEFYEAEVLIDSQTHKIVSMRSNKNDAKSGIEFSNPASCSGEVNIPAQLEKCTDNDLPSLLASVMFSAFNS